MNSKFEKLGEISEIIDSLHKTPAYSDVGQPMVRCTDVKYGFLDLRQTFKVSQSVFQEFSRRYAPKKGDIIITRVGSYGITALVEDTNFCLGQNTSAIIPKTIDSKYLYLALNSPVVKNQIEFSVVGSTQKTLSLKAIGNLDIPRFGEDAETKIGKIGSEINEKIHLNTQTNQTLESIAQAIFKSWFVDFEPVKAKMATLAEGGTREQAELAAMGAISGKSEAELAQLQQQNPEHYQQLAETAALFPSAMVESELGEIPEGWEVNNLGVISSLITKGTTPTKSDISSAEDEPKTFFLKVKDIAESGEVIRNGIEKIPTSVSMGALKRSILKTDDVLFSIAGTIGRTAIVDSDLNSANANQALAIIRLSNPKKWLSFTWFNINSDRIQNEIASKVVQGVQANASLANIRDITITIPSDEILEYFNKIIDPILLKKRLLARNTRELSELRDSLLPKLLSGEIDLSDIQSEVA